MKTINNTTNGSIILSIEAVELTDHSDNAGFSMEHYKYESGEELWCLTKGAVEYTISNTGTCYGYDRNYNKDPKLSDKENYQNYNHCDCHVLVCIHDKWEIFTIHNGYMHHTS